ncbi:MAG: NAD(P)H-quinone oxidoreductase [Deltaproteobacteria bacterium]|nr:NAD(P)H-quinone oxidoreductase [Deltaproteobacteria bacterium]
MFYMNVVEPGAPEALKLQEMDAPTPLAGEVLIKVAAAGVNRPDVLQRMGLYPPPKGASPTLGLEVAGEICSVGDGVDQKLSGQKVCALTNGGGYAEYVSVPVEQCLPVPAGLSLTEAAALPETCFTVWTNVFDRAGLQPGESLLVHGGSSGIGTTAIQLANALGSRVFATAGSDEKCQACAKLGAEIAVNYRTQDYLEVLSAATDKKGVNVILDMVGGDYISRNIKLAAMDGRIVNVAFLQGSKAEVDFMPVLLKRLTLTASTLRPQPTAAKAAIARSLQNKLWPLIEGGQFKPVIYKTFPLSDAAEAHRLMESSAHIGKIMLVVDETQ